MKFLFWNISGFDKLARRRQIQEHIMSEDVDGVGLQETIRDDFS
jgi:hypothetical protein